VSRAVYFGREDIGHRTALALSATAGFVLAGWWLAPRHSGITALYPRRYGHRHSFAWAHVKLADWLSGQSER